MQGRTRERRSSVKIRAAIALIAACATITVGWNDLASGQCQYEVTAIITSPPCPFGGTSPLIGSGLNENGEVVGRYSACPGCGTECWDSAFFWSADTGLITLPKPDGVTIMRAYDINDHQQIVGQVLYPGVAWLGFMYDMKSGEFQFLEPAVASGQASANAINNAGIVAGFRSTKETGRTNHNAVIWRPLEKGSPVEDLGVLNGPNSSAVDINDIEEIAVGWDGTTTPTSTTAQVWTNEGVIDLGPIPGGDTSFAIELNNMGIVVGSGLNLSKLIGRAFIWHDGDGKMLVVDPAEGFEISSAGRINDIGQITITCGNPGGVQRPYLWQHGEMVDLNSLTPGISGMETGRAINNQGQILLRRATTAVLLSPMDVPLGDLNYDCKVDGHDLQILLSQWGSVPRSGSGARTHPADLNGDGVVDGADLLILLANWNP